MGATRRLDAACTHPHTRLSLPNHNTTQNARTRQAPRTRSNPARRGGERPWQTRSPPSHPWECRAQCLEQQQQHHEQQQHEQQQHEQQQCALSVLAGRAVAASGLCTPSSTPRTAALHARLEVRQLPPSCFMHVPAAWGQLLFCRCRSSVRTERHSPPVCRCVASLPLLVLLVASAAQLRGSACTAAGIQWCSGVCVCVGEGPWGCRLPAHLLQRLLGAHCAAAAELLRAGVDFCTRALLPAQQRRFCSRQAMYCVLKRPPRGRAGALAARSAHEAAERIAWRPNNAPHLACPAAARHAPSWCPLGVRNHRAGAQASKQAHHSCRLVVVLRLLVHL